MELKKAPIAAVVAVFLGACSVTPEPVTSKGFLLQAREDAVRMRDGVEEVRELTLDEALARALKYNLDRRAKMMEEALALNQLDMSKLDMLPRLAAQAGYYTRNNDRIARSRTPEGEVSSSRFISSDRNHELDDLTLSWSLLDFGLGYYNSQQQADRVLIAAEKRRKAMHVLMQDVRTAYWRAVSAQKLQAQVRAITKEAESALADSRKAEADRIRGPLDSLRYQRQVLENLRLLEAIDQELSAAQVELSSLINAPVGQKMRLVEPQIKPEIKALDIPVDALEEMALAENPDLREQNYNHRIASIETRKTLLRLFPNLTLSMSAKYDSDSFQVNRSWNETGTQVSFNLMNILTSETQQKLAKAGVDLADQRRMAVQMAVVTQVHLARQQFVNALSQFNRAEDIWTTDEKIADLMVKREAAQVQSKLDRVSNQTAAVLSLLRRYQAISAVYAAEARLNATLGVEPRFDSVQAQDLSSLAKVVSRGGSVTSAYKLRVELQKAEDEVEQATLQVKTAEAAKEVALSHVKRMDEQLKAAGAALADARKLEARALEKAADVAQAKARLEQSLAEQLAQTQNALNAATGRKTASQAQLEQRTAGLASAQELQAKAGEELKAATEAFAAAQAAADAQLAQAVAAVKNADQQVDERKSALKLAERNLDKTLSAQERAQKLSRDAEQKYQAVLTEQGKLAEQARTLEAARTRLSEQRAQVEQLTKAFADAQAAQLQQSGQYKQAEQARNDAQAKADADVAAARQAWQAAKVARDEAKTALSAAERASSDSRDPAMQAQVALAREAFAKAEQNVKTADQAIDDAKQSGRAAYLAAKEVANQSDNRADEQTRVAKRIGQELERAQREQEKMAEQVTRLEQELQNAQAKNAADLQAAEAARTAEQQQLALQSQALTVARNAVTEVAAAELEQAKQALVNSEAAREAAKSGGKQSVLAARDAQRAAQDRLEAAEKSLRQAASELRDAQREDQRAQEDLAAADGKHQAMSAKSVARLQEMEAEKQPLDADAAQKTGLAQAAAKSFDDVTNAHAQAIVQAQTRDAELNAAQQRKQRAEELYEKAPKSVEDIWARDWNSAGLTQYQKIKAEFEAGK